MTVPDDSGAGSAAVDAYIAAAPDPHGSTLERLRAMIRTIVPHATEGLSYGVPAFMIDGSPVAGYAHARRHCSYFPHSGSVLEELERVEPGLLEGYDWSKGTLRFPADRVPDEPLIRRLVEIRIGMLGD